MIVHLTGSERNVEKDIQFYRKIINVLHQNDGILARDWVEAAYHGLAVKPKRKEDADWHTTIEADLDAISRAEVVIIDITAHSLFEGFQIATALQQKKPTLLLSRKPLKDYKISGYKHPMLTQEEYTTEDDLERIVAKFMKTYNVETKELRFNMFIDRQIHSYLRNVSFETGLNRSEIIRALIYQDMKKQDK